jgi:hypothetical protein
MTARALVSFALYPVARHRLTVPGVLQHPPAQVIPQRRLGQPLPVRDVVLPRPAAHRLPRHGELGTARHANHRRDGRAGEQLLERRLVHVLGVYGLLALGLVVVLEGLDLGGAAEHPGAAQVDVALLAEVVEAEALEQREGVVVGVVVVPLEALGVVEDDVAGEGVVSVDDVSALAVSCLIFPREGDLALGKRT